MNELCKMIRHQAIIQYFLPFEAADIVKMSTVFRLSSQEVSSFCAYIEYFIIYFSILFN